MVSRSFNGRKCGSTSNLWASLEGASFRSVGRYEIGLIPPRWQDECLMVEPPKHIDRFTDRTCLLPKVEVHLGGKAILW